MAKAVGVRRSISARSIVTAGSPSVGSPLGTGPRSWTPDACRLNAQLATMAPLTAISGPGIFFESRREPTITARTAVATTSEAGLAWRISRTVKSSLAMVPSPATGRSSIPANSPTAT